ncbi:MerR family transcriptional regulator [Listeria sp. PSOL-1]|uniref:MerR family transcriptional regulator n=1 Tax=Listeria sp. PSOL-1 TaxID=1844999 RepID=UPI0013D8B157|nr:MerR family transcriptional regulator [Listeria sp. PSOL-1]
MTYTIKEVSEILNISIYTIRYYDKKGLLPFVSKNKSGYREFTESDLEFMRTICCLKGTGMAIKDIRTYITYCMQGVTTIKDRKELLAIHRNNVLAEIELLKKNLKGVEQKLDVYNSPMAAKIIEKQRDFVRNEKEQASLKNPY